MHEKPTLVACRTRPTRAPDPKHIAVALTNLSLHASTAKDPTERDCLASPSYIGWSVPEISTWYMYQSHKNVPEIRPFSFITVLPALNGGEIVVQKNYERAAEESPAKVTRYDDLKGVTFYAPFGKAHSHIVGQIRRSDTHEPVQIRHKALIDRLNGYFRHPEMKSNPSNGSGGWRGAISTFSNTY